MTKPSHDHKHSSALIQRQLQFSRCLHQHQQVQSSYAWRSLQPFRAVNACRHCAPATVAIDWWWAVHNQGPAGCLPMTWKLSSARFTRKGVVVECKLTAGDNEPEHTHDVTSKSIKSMHLIAMRPGRHIPELP